MKTKMEKRILNHIVKDGAISHVRVGDVVACFNKSYQSFNPHYFKVNRIEVYENGVGLYGVDLSYPNEGAVGVVCANNYITNVMYKMAESNGCIRVVEDEKNVKIFRALNKN